MTLKVVKNTKRYEPPFLLLEDDERISPVYRFLRRLYLRGMSSQTLRAYAFDLLSFYRFLRDFQMNIENLSQDHLAEFLLAGRKQDVSPRTLNRRIIVIRSFLDSESPGLSRKLFRQTNAGFYKGRRSKALLGPTRLEKKRKLPAVKVPKTLITPLSSTQIKKLFDSLQKYRDRAIVLLMSLCGLRSCEILSLDIHDIDLIENKIRVRGKGEKERLLPISSSVHQALKRYLDYERPECTHHKCFVTLKGPSRSQPITPEGLRMIFRYRRKNSLKKAHPHRLRHTFATSLIQQGTSLAVVQKLMGHSDIETTMAYLHINDLDLIRDYHRAVKELEKINADEKKTP